MDAATSNFNWTLGALQIGDLIRRREVSSTEVVSAHLRRIQQLQPELNAAVEILADAALTAAKQADSSTPRGPLHGVPFSVKDSIDVAGYRTTAGTLGRRNAPLAERDAVSVQRLKAAGAIAVAKTNLPDLLFSFETDNLIFGRTNNPYRLSCTPGGSSGGEAALIAAGGSPLGLGSDAAGSVRLPAAFCGIAGIKPTSGRLPRTGHVPGAGGWIEALWQIGPMARRVEDLVLAIQLLSPPDGLDLTVPPAELLDVDKPRIAYFTENGIAPCGVAVKKAVEACARFLGAEPATPPGMEQAFDLEMALLGADGADGIDAYLREVGSERTHPLLDGFLSHLRPRRCQAAGLAKRWAQWDNYRANLAAFFQNYDAVVCPVYPRAALLHLGSLDHNNFLGFSYTMAWNVAGLPAATVRCATDDGMPVNVQVVANRWHELAALRVCRSIEDQFGGWQSP